MSKADARLFLPDLANFLHFVMENREIPLAGGFSGVVSPGGFVVSRGPGVASGGYLWRFSRVIVLTY